MADPITLTVVGTLVLTEGIKFLYNQAGEVLKRWRERKAGQAAAGTTAGGTAAAAPATVPSAAPLPPPDVLDGALTPPVIHLDRMEPLADSMRALWSDLGAYAQGIEAVDASDADLVAKADGLRRQLEAVFGQRITFKGEPRPASGTPMVVGIADVKTIAGEVAAVLAGSIEGGEVRGELKVDTVEAGGKAYGVKADRIGG